MAARGLGVPWPATREQGVRWLAGIVVVGALGLGWLQGGYAASRYAPAAVAAIWLALGAWATMRWPRPSRAVVVALGAYALLTAWSALSITWASTPGSALDATARTALYGVVLAVALLPRWPAASVRRLLVLVGAGTLLLAVATLVRIDLAVDPSRWFIDGRLAAPTGYVNATAGLWGIALLPLVHLAAGGLRGPYARTLALAGACVVLQTSLLSQSRGAVLALGVAAVLLLVLSPARGPVAVVLGGLLLVTLPVAPALLDVRGAATARELAAGIDGAVARIAVATAVLVLLGTAWQVLLARLPTEDRAALASPRVGTLLVRVLAAVLVLGALVAVGNPVAWVGDRADQALHGGYGTVAPSGSRLTGSLGSDRGDMYRVALELFASRPLTGVGAEDFQAPYLRERDSTESARFAHSLPLGVLAGIGLVGFLLLAIALTAPVLAALRRRDRGPGARLDDAARAGQAAALAALTAWLAQATWDWTWQFPALVAPALVLLGAAARATGTDGAAPDAALLAIRARARAHGVAVPDDDPPAGPVIPSSPRGRGALAALLLVAVAGTAAFALLGASSYLFRSGTAKAREDPAGAARALARAARLNPLDGDALLSRAVVVRRRGDLVGWRRDLERTIDRAPEDWFARLQLGMADAATGDRAGALRNVSRAAELNPNQPTVREVLAVLQGGGRVDPDEAEARIAGRLAERLRSVGP